MIKFQLPIKPLSNNRLWQGKRFKTREYNKYIELVLMLLPKGVDKIIGEYSIDIRVYIKSAWLKSDVSNFIKGLEDCIVKAGLVDDDRFCTDLRIRKYKSDEDRVEVIINN